MYLGRVMEHGPVDDIFHAPKHPYTRALLRSIPSLQATPQSPCRPSPARSPPARSARGLPLPPALPGRDPGLCDQRVPALRPVGDSSPPSCFLYHDVEATS